MRKKIAVYLSLLLLFVCLAVPKEALAFGDTVESIAVSVSSEQAPPPDRVAKRMAASIKTIGEHLVIGHKVSEIDSGRASYEKLVKEVFDRVLVGYTVSDVAIEPGQITNIKVSLEPWGETVKTVKLEIDFQHFSPEIAALIKQDMGNVQDKVGEVLIGLPIDAVEWAGAVSQSLIREKLAAQLPEFYTNLEIVPGVQTVVKLSLSPNGPVVRDTHVSIRSSSIPNILLLEARPIVESSVQQLNGLPVAFVERHSEYFINRIKGAAAAHPVTERYGLVLTPQLYPGSDTELVLKAETTKYRVWLEGYMDIGRKADTSSVKFHLGRRVNSDNELFTEVTFIPSTVYWNFAAGWGHKLSKDNFSGIKYDFTEQETTFWAHHRLNNNWSLRLERTPKNGRNEIGIRYKLHEFVSLEYIFNNEDRWLRVVGNL